MKVLRFVLRSAGPAALAMGVLGAAGAAFNGGLIAVVHHALGAQGQQRMLALAFVGLGLGKLVTAYASGRMADAYAQESVAELRRELIGKLLDVPYARFEQLGAPRVHAALTSDVSIINASLQASAQAVVNLAILIGATVYLVYLDPRAGLALLALAGLCFLVYRATSRNARALLSRARAEHDRLYSLFAALTDGIKELKLHARRRRAFVDGPLLEATESMLEHDLLGHSRYLLAQGVNGLLLLTMIGLVLFALPLPHDARGGLVSGYVLTGLYLLGPLTALLRLLPVYTAAEIALRRIEEVGVRLDAADPEHDADPEQQPGFDSLELCAVTHLYEGPRGGFELGPISLRIAPAEIVFVTGGNGSGKSTLGKLLTGLYAPGSGELRWDGRAVGPEQRDSYRQLWSAVFSELHVFDRLYGLPGRDLDARANAWIAELGLAGNVRVEGGVLSSVDLSRGQRKRLALLTALLEDRPIYLFDEWAADQDGEFKQVFYRRLLPRLKQRGKAVIVITHDDRYYGVADRLIELVEGRLAEVRPAAEA